MVKPLKLNDIRKLYPRRDKQSHKGMNGRVMIVGGSKDFYGAPVLSALGALYGGADLVHLVVPECNFEVSRSLYPDFIVHPVPGDYVDVKAIERIIEVAQRCDSCLLGPGLGDSEATSEAVHQLIEKLEIPTVLDASAIQVLGKMPKLPSQPIIITPHHNEFETLTGKDIKVTGSLSNKIVLLRTLATDLKIHIVLKGPMDLLASEEGDVVTNETGNPGMTVGGSGDVLSGFIASLIAQGAAPFAACQAGTYIVGKAGDELFKQKSYCFSASDLALELPYVIRTIAA